MSSDTSRTPKPLSRPSPDNLDALGKQLGVLARVGLLPSKIVERQQKNGDLGMVLGLADDVPSVRQQADRLVDAVIEACDALGSGPLGESARKLFGTGQGEREFPYARRHVAAAEAWNPDIKAESFDRRYMKRVLVELENQLLKLRREQARSALDARVRSRRSQPISFGDDVLNSGFRKLEFQATSHVVGKHRIVAHTDWTWRLRVLRDGEQFYRLRTRMDMDIVVEAIDDSIEVERYLGVDREGRQTWLLRLLSEPRRGQTVEIRYRNRFEGMPPEEDDSGFLAVGASSSNPIESGNLTVVFTAAEKLPIQSVRFITLKGTLPRLQGRSWPLNLAGMRLNATFDYMVPWHSHGIYWWFE